MSAGRTAAGRDDGGEGRRAAAPIVGATVAGSTGPWVLFLYRCELWIIPRVQNHPCVCVFAANVSAEVPYKVTFILRAPSGVGRGEQFSSRLLWEIRRT